jgi:hypothetical protein
MFQEIESKPKLCNGLYRVDTLGLSFDGLEKSGIHITYLGDQAKALKYISGQKGEVYFYDGMFHASLGETWESQLQMTRHAEIMLRQIYPRISLQPFAEGSTLLEAVSVANKKFGVNPLYSDSSRFADGSFGAGNLSRFGGSGEPGRLGGTVHSLWSHNESNLQLGLLLQAVFK